MEKVKVGMVGLGNIGSHHIRYMKAMENIELAGVCDIVREKADRFAAEYNSKAYYSHEDLFRLSGIEAVLVAVPHYDHVSVAVDAFNRGLHVLCEKPLAVHVNDAEKIIEAYEKAREKKTEIKFGIMFMERTLPHYKKIKEIIDGDELGKLLRATWINTAWFRPQAYYNSGGWRATWAGEGGGILTNQCPHNLDMYQWLFGMPVRVSGHANIGKYHDIEVEDEVTAYFEHRNGMIGHFITSTAESPGTNRLEIIGENGKLVFEGGKIVLYRNRISMLTFSKETKESFARLENCYAEIPLDIDVSNAHKKVTDNFIHTIMNGEGSLIAYGTEGMNSLTLANAIMLSSFSSRTIDIPIDADDYENRLTELIKHSRYIKKIHSGMEADMSHSFQSGESGR